jgi:hypothetical protein
MESAQRQAPEPETRTGGGKIAAWLERIDPGSHRRVKGLRLVTAYAIAAMLGGLLQRAYALPGGTSLSFLAAGFALWASVSEGQATRWLSTRDLAILNAAAALGSASVIWLAPIHHGRPGAEWILVTGAFLVGYLKRFGILGAGMGSQIYIGQLLAYGEGSTRTDLPLVALAAVIAAAASIVPRLLSGPAEHPAALTPDPSTTLSQARISRELRMGLQAGAAALVIVLINSVVGLRESAWAITASTYVIAGSAAGTVHRVRQRMVGTLIGVPLGIACLPIATHLPPLAWMLAALAMIIYAMALPERYDIACAAYAFTLMVTLAVSGETSISILAARAWETLIGGALGVATAKIIFPLMAADASPPGASPSARTEPQPEE